MIFVKVKITSSDEYTNDLMVDLVRDWDFISTIYECYISVLYCDNLIVVSTQILWMMTFEENEKMFTSAQAQNLIMYILNT